MTNVDWQVIDIKPTFTDTSNNSPFQAILLTPKSPAADGRLPPLVTMIHGVPGIRVTRTKTGKQLNK